MKQAFIISGPNGCGKTTLADKLVEEFKLPFINADNIALEGRKATCGNLNPTIRKIPIALQPKTLIIKNK